MATTSRCVVFVPVANAIDPGCEDALRELERRGYPVWLVRGYAAIDAARNQMATDALAQRFDELMWIDDVNLDNAAGTTLLSTTTDASGDYSLSVSSPLLSQYSSFEIQVVLPAGDAVTVEYAGGGGVNSAINGGGYSNAFTLIAGGSQTVNGGLVAQNGSGSGPATVNGEVWMDSNDDGLLDNGEVGASGVTVNLDNASGTLLQSTTTNNSGNYSFSVSASFLSSGYQIQVVIPNNDTATIENASGAGINSNINASGDSGLIFLYAGGTQSINAGLALDPVVSGEVWLDSNADGLLDNGETGAAGVSVYLDNSQGTQLLTTTTNASGNYQFIVPPSLLGQSGYEVQVAFPSGQMATLENVSGSGINSNINTSGYSKVFALSLGDSQQIDAGLASDPVVSGEVWLDSNVDGLLDNGESGVSGVTMNLDNASGTTLMSTTTDADGNYQFIVSPSVFGQGSGGFEIQVVFPSGDMATLENVSGSGINSNIDTSGYSNVFGLAPAGKQQVNAGLAPDPVVSGEVWFDSNADGLLDNGEAGQSSVTVNLDNDSGQVLMTTTTDANGNYQFNVSQSVLNQSSSFEIQVVLPSGDTATLENVSGSGINSNIDSDGYSDVFGLAPATTRTVNAGLAAQAVVSGEVWLDSNGDGLLDNGEAGQAGVTVELDNAQGQVLQSKITDSNGNYQFIVPVASSSSGSGMGMGSGYEIQVAIPTDDVATLENVYGSGINSEIDASGDSNVFYLYPGASQQINAGVAPQPVVSGEVWYDSNGNGVLDNGESGMSGITVNLDSASGTTLMTTTTDANGNYQFPVSQSVLNEASYGSGMSGSFEIQVMIPSGDVATLENVIGSGINSNINTNGYSNVFSLAPAANQQVNAGVAPQPVVSGEVWYDSNGDGLLENGESGLSGITVNLDNAAGTTLMTRTTDANGNYQFSVPQSVLNEGGGSGLGSGFEIQVVIPPGDVATYENYVGADINSNIDAQGYSNVFALPAAASQQVNAGLVASTATVNGEVWLDSDGDGLLDNGESGMSGVTVNLDSAQGTVLQSTSTDASGNYSLNVNLGSGSGLGGGYQIQVVFPSGDTATVENASGSGINSNIDAGGYSNLLPLSPATSQQVNAGIVSGSGSGGGTATVSGEVWLDNNGDGNLDEGESGFTGITVNLLNSTGQVVMTTTTDDEGDYDFTVPVGSGSGSGNSYQVQVVLPSGDEATIPGADSDIAANGMSPLFNVPQQGGGAIMIMAGIRSTVVNTTQDNPNGALPGNKVTLRDAIDTVINGLDNPVTFTVNGIINLQKVLPVLSKNITIDGSAAAITVKGNGNAANPYRIFTVNAGVTAEIDGLTIQGGFLQNGDGGGILNAGNLTLNNVTLQGNQTNGGDGGGIYNDSDAQLQLQTVTISGRNTASGGGGGLYNLGSVTICCDSVIENNRAGGGGGGIFNYEGTIQAFDNTQINDNGDSGLRGGGVENYDGKFQMYGGSISVNQESRSFGGGLDNRFGTVTLTGVSIQGNKARGYGGGIYTYEGALTLTNNVTIGGKANANTNFAAKGGGMYVNDTDVKMTGGEIINNTATTTAVLALPPGGGGGLYVNAGSVTLTDVSISGNGSTGDGGGLYVRSGNLKLIQDVIYLNTTNNPAGAFGAGMYINRGTVTLSGGTIQDNKVLVGNGGGMYNNAGTLTLRSYGTTIALPVFILDNFASNNGGGMYLANSSSTTFDGASVSGNQTATNKQTTGRGVLEQITSFEVSNPGGLTDNDDDGGHPYRTGIA